VLRRSRHREELPGLGGVAPDPQAVQVHHAQVVARLGEAPPSPLSEQAHRLEKGISISLKLEFDTIVSNVKRVLLITETSCAKVQDFDTPSLFERGCSVGQHNYAPALIIVVGICKPRGPEESAGLDQSVPKLRGQ
jgi:hypothetical protein